MHERQGPRRGFPEGPQGLRERRLELVQIGEVPVSPDGLLAVVSDKPVDLPVPVLDLNDVTGVAALIIKHFPRVTHELEP